MKFSIAYQGIRGSYSESCAKENYPDCETIPCKTFDECFEIANSDSNIRAIIPESIDSGIIALIFESEFAISKHSSNVLHGIVSQSG